MRTKYLMYALAALLFAGCSDDEIDSGGTGGLKPESGKTAFGFSLKDFARGSVPLSKADPNPLDKLPASVAESTLDSLSVYVFDQHADTPYDSTKTVFAEEFKVGGGDLAVDATDKIAQIQLSGLGKKKIYFVANAIGQHDLDKLKLGESTEAQFLEMKTNLLTTAGQLACPLIMTAVDSIEITDAAASNPTDGGGYTVGIGSTVTGRAVNLKRIVARFDIENYAETSDLVIESIELNNVHPSALVNKVQNFGSTKNSEYAYTTDPLTETMNKFDFTRYPNANNGRAASVFYLYPDLNNGSGADGEGTEADRFYLTLYGKTKKTGASVVYNVYLYKNNADRTKDAVIVKPNNQYLIKINDLDPTTLKATITVQDWLIGDTVDYEMSEGTIKLSCVEFPLVDVTPGPGQQLNIPAARGGDASVPVNVKVEAISEWQLLKGYNAEWIDTTTNITADLPVGTLTTVKPQEANPYNKERRGTLVFRNVQRPSIMQTLIVTQKAGAATNVNIGKLSAKDAATYQIVSRPTDGTTNNVGTTEKADTLMLPGVDAPAFLTNAKYDNIEIEVDSTATTQEWSLSVDRIDSTWISITDGPVLNKQCKAFKVSLTKNDSIRRTGTIRLYDRQDETIYRDLVVVQEGAAVTATLETAPGYTVDTGAGFIELAKAGDDQHYTVTFPKENYTKEPYRIKLTTNGTWRIHDVADTEYRNWLDAYSLNKLDRRVMSGMGDAIIEIGTTANDSASVRTGNVILTIGDTEYTIAVTKLSTTPVITLDDSHVTGNHIDFASAAAAQGVRFITNDNWKVTAVNGVGAGVTADTADWLSFSNASDATDAAITEGSGSMVLKISAAAQTETGGVAGAGAPARSATVTIKCNHKADGTDDPDGDTNPTIVLTIYQAGIEATPVPVVP